MSGIAFEDGCAALKAVARMHKNYACMAGYDVR